MTTEIDLNAGCLAYNELYETKYGLTTQYGYVPSQGAGIAFCVLFALTMAAHIVQFCWKRTWWCSLFAIGAMGKYLLNIPIRDQSNSLPVELLGWAGRLWAAECPYNSTAFMIQICTLIIAPTFFTAGIYVLLGRLIRLFGPESSILTPKLYLWIFCTCDIISLVVQAAGGGLASSESGVEGGNTKPGTDTMVAGIIFQLVSITIFIGFAADFIRRVSRMGQLKKLTSGTILPLTGAIVLSVAVIYVRSIYRAIELVQGWSGFLITHEVYLVAMDGAMMVIAVGVFNIFHPGWLLPNDVEYHLPKFQPSLELK
ncbi:RTA1-domain-containing protein [Penicillium taxi]|uniref:RTA1-domain-containing protein n=1 Tax=Penicillium taxi TaxID=168475 RepID=UPI002544D91E|nr:RTA1-domain-containing protein [Penicillium taxi]KAJ5888692.1 RTA1-domain-containing protein [Penicillium taxi]